jgi:predicted hexulose-6-phosphate isomerase
MTQTADPPARLFGIYEKALPSTSWADQLTTARDCGFDYVELSIDESDARLARLEWSPAQRKEAAAISRELAVPIFSICLSAHRRFGLGSSDPGVRARALQLLDDAVGFAADLGVRVVQIAGYHAYYEASDDGARDRYVDGLRWGAALAAQHGVMLAVENIDTSDMASADDVLELLDDVPSPWFQSYPDVGNFAVHALPVAANTTAVVPSAVGFHLKDARPGEPRRVPFGTGTVPFADVFRALAESRYRGPFTLEMWNDDSSTAAAVITDALLWIKDLMAEVAPSLLTAGDCS